MPVSPAAAAPLLSPRVRRSLTALWISLGLHGALIALVQVAPTASSPASLVIEARLQNLAPAAVSVPAVTTSVEAGKADVPQTEPVPMVAAAAEPMPELVVPKAAPVPPATPPAAPPVAEPMPNAPVVESPRPLLEIPAGVDLNYYSAREVDVFPRVLQDILPDYPPEADRRRLSGTVRLQIKIEADGRISDIEVVESSPPGVFDESALAAFRAARFSPAQKNGLPVRARVLIEVKYDFEGRLR